MRRLLPLLALPGLLASAASAAPSDRDAHRHPGLLFQLRFEPQPNTAFVYRAFLAEPDHPATLVVERSNGWLGDEGQVDLTPARCPAAAAAVMRLASLNLPAAALERIRPYDGRDPEPASYHFSGFVHFPNGGEGEVSFTAYDAPGQRADPLLDWARGLVRAVDACGHRAVRRAAEASCEGPARGRFGVPNDTNVTNVTWKRRGASA
jgi:hypothetical protein